MHDGRRSVALALWLAWTAVMFGGPRHEWIATPENLAEINSRVQPGDVVLLGDGIYRTPIAPGVSGTETAPIVYASRNRHGATFRGVELAIELSHRGWIEVRGIKALDTARFIVAVGADHLTIDGCHFENTKGFGGWENCRFRDVGDGIRISNNLFRNGTDLVSIGPGDFHLIENNVFDTAEHTPLVLLGVQRSVVRNNVFRNPIQRGMEVFSSRHKDRGRATRHCVIEGNSFTTGIRKEPVMGKKTSNCAFKISSQQVIYRRNLINHCQAAVDWSKTSNPSQEARRSVGNRFYHNVINDCGYEQGLIYTIAIASNGEIDADFGDNVMVNNIFSGNHFYEDILLKGLPRTVCAAFLRPCRSEAFRFFSNLFWSDYPGAPLFAEAGGGASQSYSLGEFETAFPGVASGNGEGDPRYRDASAGDFRLAAGSAAINAGRWLTSTVAASSGREIAVQDASYFSDGFGLIEGDLVAVGEHRRLRVTRVDYEGNRLELDRAIDVAAGAGVTLAFNGSAPDVGAIEFEW